MNLIDTATPNKQQADPGKDRVAPSESYIWKNLLPGNNGYKTNGDGLNFGYDRGGGGAHQAEIEVWDKNGKHLGTIDPLTGKQIRGPQEKKNVDRKIFGSTDDPNSGSA